MTDQAGLAGGPGELQFPESTPTLASSLAFIRIK